MMISLNTLIKVLAYSSNSASSDVDPSRYTVETGSTKSDTIKQDTGSKSKSGTIISRHNELKSSSGNNALEVPADLQRPQVKPNASIPMSDDKDDEYEKMCKRANPLSVDVDNVSCENATVIQVIDSNPNTNRQEVLLEAVQILTDNDFIFTRVTFASDGLWSMNVFYVTDLEGNKVEDEKRLDHIQKVLGSGTSLTNSTKSDGWPVIELIGSDRPGLITDMCTVLLELRCKCCECQHMGSQHKGCIYNSINR
uniref:ACT domain-containing protein ACR n=1 Tax=Helianthus annuus TaxID=4232 RepID=A0A251TJN9_HELAN